MKMGCTVSNHITIQNSCLSETYCVENNNVILSTKKEEESEQITDSKKLTNGAIVTIPTVIKGDLNQRGEAKRKRQKKMRDKREQLMQKAELMSDKVMEEKETLSYWSSRSRSDSRATTPIELHFRKRSSVVSPTSGTMKRSVTFSEETKSGSDSENSPTDMFRNRYSKKGLRKRSSDQYLNKYGTNESHNRKHSWTISKHIESFQIEEPCTEESQTDWSIGKSKLKHKTRKNKIHGNDLEITDSHNQEIVISFQSDSKAER